MLNLYEVRIGNFLEVHSMYGEGSNKTGTVTEISQKQVAVSGKWFNLSRLAPVEITEDILRHAGFKQFNWLKDSSVFECDHFKCTLDENGVSLFCDNIKNLQPVKHLHALQNLYFDLVNEELKIDYDYIKSSKKEMA